MATDSNPRPATGVPDSSTNDIAAFMEGVMSGETSDPFYFYEPWDSPDEGRYHAKGFQAGFHSSTSRIRLTIAGNRTGKTIASGVEAVIMMTGEIPFSMRYRKGELTTHVRPWKYDRNNEVGHLCRLRYGFLDPETGEWTPPMKHPEMPCPENRTRKAPCGYVEGAGVFPAKKICPWRNSSVWIGTYKETRDERWVKFLSGLIPKQFLDTRFSSSGYSIRDQKFRLINGNEIVFITYEQGPERAQGAGVWAVFLDEEPRQRKFFTECDQRLIDAGHEGWIAISFTPLLGLSWSYTDLMVPSQSPTNPGIDVFHATQYDSPFIKTETVDARKGTYKAWEIQARVYGVFSEMQGRPYYDYVKLNGDERTAGWLRRFVPHRELYTFRPKVEAVHLEELLGDVSIREKTTSSDHPGEDYWEIYEEMKMESGAYFISADTAEGSESEDEAADRNAAYIFRIPMVTEKPNWPVLVGAMRTSIPTLQFAREIWYAAMYYNYATLVPEVTGEQGSSLATEIRAWPFFYQSTVIRDKTHKAKAIWGFDTSKKTRTPVFDAVGDFINDHDTPQCLRHFWLLKEAAELVYGRNGRPDHPDRGSSDCLVAFGVGLYSYATARHQFNCNSSYLLSHRSEAKEDLKNQPWARYLEEQRQRDPRQKWLGEKRDARGLPLAVV